jgi:hypothetical protein
MRGVVVVVMMEEVNVLIMGKLGVIMTKPSPVLYPFIVIVDMAYEPPPPPADAVPIS